MTFEFAEFALVFWCFEITCCMVSLSMHTNERMTVIISVFLKKSLSWDFNLAG